MIFQLISSIAILLAYMCTAFAVNFTQIGEKKSNKLKRKIYITQKENCNGSPLRNTSSF